jgi:LacI family transcriptional regulator
VASIRDVAQKAGVSIASVSYALNGSPKVSEPTRVRILEAARELNFQPSGLAKNLKRKRTNLVGIFTDGMASAYFTEFIRGIQEMLLSRSYETVVVYMDPKSNRQGLHLVKERWVDGGIILAPFQMVDSELSSVSQHAPLVLMEAPPDIVERIGGEGRLARISVDNHDGIKQVIAHLYAQGRRNIGFLRGKPGSWDSDERYQAYLSELQLFGLTVDTSRVLSGDYRQDRAACSVTDFFAKGGTMDALVCANDEMAIGAFRAMRDQHIRVPEDIALVGFDDLELCTLISPQLSSVSYDRYAMGAAAVNILLGMINEEVPVAPVQFPTLLQIRESSRLLN